jgi:hypothetical protein
MACKFFGKNRKMHIFGGTSNLESDGSPWSCRRPERSHETFPGTWNELVKFNMVVVNSLAKECLQTVLNFVTEPTGRRPIQGQQGEAVSTSPVDREDPCHGRKPSELLHEMLVVWPVGI